MEHCWHSRLSVCAFYFWGKVHSHTHKLDSQFNYIQSHWIRYKYDETEIEKPNESGISIWEKLFRPRSKQPTVFSSRLVQGLTFLCVISMIVLSFLLSKANMTSWYAIMILIILVTFLFPSMVIIWCQPQVTNIFTFKVGLFVRFLLKKGEKNV